MVDYLVSIIVPVYDVEKYIARCARSLFNQDYSNLEYLFVDDCTPDNSISILLNVLEEFPEKQEKIRIIKNDRNRGLAYVRNKGVSEAKGEFVVQVDSDDYVEPSLISELIKYQQMNDADIVTAGYYIHYKSRTELYNPRIFETAEQMCKEVLSTRESHNIWAKLIRTNLFKEKRIKCKEGVNLGEDYQTTPLLFYYAKTIANIQQPLYHYDCTRQDSYTRTFSEDKHNQSWESLLIAHDFFKDKGELYKEPMIYSKAVFASRSIIDCVRDGGEEAYFKMIRSRIQTINLGSLNNYPIAYLLPLYINNYWLLKIYIKLCEILKSFKFIRKVFKPYRQ